MFGNGCGRNEELRLKLRFEWRPVAADYAVAGDNGLEDTAVVVGLVAVFLGQDYVSALVANQIFIVRRNQKKLASAETSGAAVVGEEKVTAIPSLFADIVFLEFYSPSAVADVQAGPPDKILQSGRLAATEVSAGELHKCLIPVSSAWAWTSFF